MQDLLKQQFQKSLELTAALTFDWKRTRRELQFAKSMKFLGLRGFLSGIFFWAAPLLLWKIRSPTQRKGGENMGFKEIMVGVVTGTIAFAAMWIFLYTICVHFGLLTPIF